MTNLRFVPLALAVLCLPAAGAPGEPPPEIWGLTHLADYLALTPADISFRPDYTEPDSFRLQVLSGLMENPLGMIDYAAGLRRAYTKGQPEVTAALLSRDLAVVGRPDRTPPYRPTGPEMQQGYNLFYASPGLNQLMARAGLYLDVIFPRSAETALASLSPAQRRFLTAEFKELLVSHAEEEFFTPEQLDSVEKIEEKYTEEFTAFGWRIDKDPILTAGFDCLRDLMPEIAALRRDLAAGTLDAGAVMKGLGQIPEKGVGEESYLGRQPGWKVGGPGPDYYEGDYWFIFDFGGDDVYRLSYDPARPHGVIIIDLAGDDRYRGLTDFALASGCLSAGLLLDFGGNDRYDAQSFALGSGYFGFGLLYDAAGDDRYDGDTHVMAAGSFGLGLLIDEGGRDCYNAALYAQGFGFTEGMGVIYDTDGSDSYYAGGKYKDILRYEDHYLSLSQGFGYGLRPWTSGGIGAIIDDRGSDANYNDIIGQGTSYWWSLGVIYDSSGNDTYNSFQYAQGCATHMTLGVLIDDAGNDAYIGKGLMQGVGHDYSCGLLLDRAGDDLYTAWDLSQAAGSANGVGILIDNAGADRYFIRNADNTHGYGNPRRDFGSIGLFLDLGGEDLYNGYGGDNLYWRTPSQWGGGMDIERAPRPDSAVIGEVQ